MGHCWERERDEPAEMARLKLEKGFVKVKERKAVWAESSERESGVDPPLLRLVNSFSVRLSVCESVFRVWLRPRLELFGLAFEARERGKGDPERRREMDGTDTGWIRVCSALTELNCFCCFCCELDRGVTPGRRRRREREETVLYNV